MAFLRLHTNNLRNNNTKHHNTPPAIQLRLKWRNGAWHLFNIWFFEPVMAFTDLEQAQMYCHEHRMNAFELEGVGKVTA